MEKDVIINKASIIEKCIKRVNEEYAGNSANLENFTKQDSIILNIQRASEACIDMAMYIVAEKSLGIPQNSREAFELLYINDIIDKNLCSKMKSMIGFRNIAVHDYQSVDLDVVKQIIENHIQDLKEFSLVILGNF